MCVRFAGADVAVVVASDGLVIIVCDEDLVVFVAVDVPCDTEAVVVISVVDNGILVKVVAEAVVRFGAGGGATGKFVGLFVAVVPLFIVVFAASVRGAVVDVYVSVLPVVFVLVRTSVVAGRKGVMVVREGSAIDSDIVVGLTQASDMVSGIVVVVTGDDVNVEAEGVMPVVTVVVGSSGEGIKGEDEARIPDAVRKEDEEKDIPDEDVFLLVVDKKALGVVGFKQPAGVNT